MENKHDVISLNNMNTDEIVGKRQWGRTVYDGAELMANALIELEMNGFARGKWKFEHIITCFLQTAHRTTRSKREKRLKATFYPHMCSSI